MDTKNEKAIEVTNTKTTEPIYYKAKTQNGWGIGMNGLEAEDGSELDHAGIIGMPMTNFMIDGTLVKKARIRTKRGKWLDYVTEFDGKTGIGNDVPITGIEIVGKGLVFAVHALGGQWLNPVFTSDTDGEILVGSGFIIDAIWIDAV